MTLPRPLHALLLCLTLLPWMASCSDASYPDAPGTEASESLVTLTLYLDLQTSPDTRSWSDPDLDPTTELQARIAPEDYYVILLNTDGTIVQVPDFVEVPNNSTGYTTITARVPMRQTYVKYRVLANVAQGGNFGTTPQEVKARLRSYVGEPESRLVQDLRASGFVDGKWPLASDGKYLPMQSPLSAPLMLDHDRIEFINLYRSLAKIAVVYAPEEADTPYTLMEVRVHNAHSYGAFISPFIPNADPRIQFEYPYVTEGTPVLASPTSYSVTANSLTDAIFVAEHANNATAADLYLEVRFHEDPEKLRPDTLADSTTEPIGDRWYTLHFTDDAGAPASAAETFDIVRNHSYVFIISRIAPEVVVKVKEYDQVVLDPEFGLLPP